MNTFVLHPIFATVAGFAPTRSVGSVDMSIQPGSERTRGSMPGKIGFIVGRFPEFEFELYHLCSRDPDFRSLCEDYQLAVSARRYWQQTPGGERWAEEYRCFLLELEDEILAHVSALRSSGRRSERP